MLYYTAASIIVGENVSVPKGNPQPSACFCQNFPLTTGTGKFEDETHDLPGKCQF